MGCKTQKDFILNLIRLSSNIIHLQSLNKLHKTCRKDLFIFGKVTNVKNFKTNHMKHLYIFSDCYLWKKKLLTQTILVCTCDLKCWILSIFWIFEYIKKSCEYILIFIRNRCIFWKVFSQNQSTNIVVITNQNWFWLVGLSYIKYGWSLLHAPHFFIQFFAKKRKFCEKQKVSLPLFFCKKLDKKVCCVK